MTIKPRDLFPLAAALGIGCGVTVLVVTVFSYLAPPMAAELGMTRTALSGALSLHLGALIFALPLGGYLADRWGARPLIIASAITFGLALFAIGHAGPSVPLIYALFIIAGFAGCGVAPVVYARVIVHRFDKHRGLALGIALTGGGLAQIILPQLIRPVVLDLGWRSGWTTIALIGAVGGVLVGLLAGREQGSGASGAVNKLPGYSLREALATRPFWQMAFAFSMLGVVMSGVVSQLSAIWPALGLKPETVPAFQAALGASTIAGRMVGGLAMDRFPAQLVGAGAAILGSTGLLLLTSDGAAGVLLLAAAAGLGIANGAESDVVSYMSSRLFGLANFARIYAMQGSIFLIGFSAGPVLSSTAGATIGFRTTLIVGAALLLLSAAVLGTLGRHAGAREPT